MFVWVDDEIEENEEVKSNEVVQNDSQVAVELMEETMKKNAKLSKKLSAEKMKGKFTNFLLFVSVFINLCFVAKLSNCKKMALDELGSDNVVVWS